MYKSWIALAGASALVAACSTYNTTSPVTRDAAAGAALGALAGAAIGNNTGSGSAGTGAAIVAVVGGIACAAAGCHQQGGCGATNVNRRQFYDEVAHRYYYYDAATGRYYWENGDPRY